MPNDSAHIDFDFIAKYLAKECSDVERREMEQWLENDANKAEFEAIKEIWDFTPDEVEVDVNKAWSKVSPQIEEDVISIDRPATNRPYLAWAAGLALIVAVSATLWFNASPEMMNIESGNQLAVVELSDGSTVTLSESSSLKYSENFEDDTRDVWLTGVGYFEVAKNEGQPFIVHTDVGDVRVVGTAFEVDARGQTEALSVEVEEGIVQVEVKEAEPARVTAGQVLKVSPSGNLMTLNDLEPGAFFWKDKTIKFKRTQLVEVVEVLNSLLQVNIVIETESINHCELTATFKNDDIETILEVISATLSLQLESVDGSYVLSGEGC